MVIESHGYEFLDLNDYKWLKVYKPLIIILVITLIIF
jgi:hypothetical protein